MTEHERRWWDAWLSRGDELDHFGEGLATPDERWDDVDWEAEDDEPEDHDFGGEG